MNFIIPLGRECRMRPGILVKISRAAVFPKTSLGRLMLSLIRKQVLVVSTIAGVGVLSSIACVSVNLGPKEAEQSKGVQLQAPPAPYRPLPQPRADGAWQNSTNGNSISYFSSCNDLGETTLELAAQEVVAELAEPNVLKRSPMTFNGREALDQEIEGKAEGVPVHIRSVLFKKNGCTYTLNFIGTPRNFDSDRAIHQSFLREFRAP